jgi:hypothetical protein
VVTYACQKYILPDLALRSFFSPSENESALSEWCYISVKNISYHEEREDTRSFKKIVFASYYLFFVVLGAPFVVQIAEQALVEGAIKE